MSLMDRLKRMFGTEERRYEYMCPNCETTFESPNADMSTVSCPHCGDTQVRSTAMAEPGAKEAESRQ